MAYIYDLTDTWSAAGTVFNGIKLNVTNSASASGSKLMTLQIGGTEFFGVSKEGDVRIGNGGDLRLSSATGTTTSGGDSQIFNDANNMIFTTGTTAAERMRITSSGDLGIGTNSPATKLHILTASATAVALRAGNSVSFAEFQVDASGNSQLLAPGGAQIFSTNGSERMRINSSGNVGIGTSSPSTRLDVNSTVTLSGAENAQLRWLNSGKDWRANTSAGGNWYLYDATNNKFPFTIQGNAPSDAFLINSSGNVGIGTSSPTTKLQIGDISAADATYQGRIKLEDTSASLQTIGGLEFATSAFGAGYGWKINSIDSSGVHLAFGTRQNSATWSEAMRIGSSGSLLVGTTAPMAASGSNEFKITSAGVWPLSLNGNDRGLLVRNSSASSGFYAYFEYNGGTNNGSISWSGGTTAYNTTSDYRLKEIDGPITNSGAYIDALKPVEGWWKADGKRFIGFLAHQVQEVSQTPVVVGEKDGAEMQQMDYSAPELIANLIAEVQSLRARVAQLEGN